MVILFVFYALVCVSLILIILLQRGKGGGLVGLLGGGSETLFGTSTGTFLTRLTAVLATMFILTCLLLSILASRGHISTPDKKLIDKVASEAETTETTPSDVVIPDAGSSREAAPAESLPAGSK